MTRVARRATFPSSTGILRVIMFALGALSSVVADCVVASIRGVSPPSILFSVCFAEFTVFVVMRFVHAVACCRIRRLCCLSPCYDASSLVTSLFITSFHSPNKHSRKLIL